MNGSIFDEDAIGGNQAVKSVVLKIAEVAKHLSTTAKLKHRWEFLYDQVGYNYRMSNIHAAVGCAQLENISKILKSKRKNFFYYKNVFKNEKDFFILNEPDDSRINFWFF